MIFQQYQIPRQIASDVIRACIPLSDRTLLEELDCSKSFSRQPTEKTLDEILEIGFNDGRTHYIFILRDGEGNGDYWDVGFTTIGMKPEYFLWLNLTPKNASKIIEQFTLQKL